MSNCKKIGYRDRIAAMMALASCKHDTNGARNESRIYRCPICNKFHLTSQKTFKEQRTEKRRLKHLDSFALSYYKDCEPFRK